MGDFVNLVNDSGDGFDQQQLERAIRESLANTAGAQPEQTPRQKPSLYDDHDLEAALAESMRTFEAEQGGGAAGHTAGRKRSSSDEGPEPPQQPHPQQDCHMADAQHQQQQQQQAPAPQPAGGALKRQRSVSTAGNGAGAGCSDPGGQQPVHHASAHPRGRLGRVQGGVVVTTAIPQQPGHHLQHQQHPPGVLLPQPGVQRSASITNAAVGLRPWPSRGILQQQHGAQWGLGRSASAHGLQDLGGYEDTADTEELAGSRPSSPAGHHAHDELVGFLPEPDAEDEDDYGDDLMDAGAISDSSMSSIAHESGLPHTISTWGPALLQAAAAQQPAAAAAPQLFGPGPAPGDPSEWCIHSRQFYEGQPVYWQQWRQGYSYSGKVLSVEGATVGRAALYTAELHCHPAGLTYVEATAEQLHPQLRLGELVWCKPGAVRRNQWSQQGPLFRQLHPPGSSNARPQSCEEASWQLGLVQQLQLFEGKNPIAELRIIGTGGNDCAWFRVCQLELMRELGESSAAAEQRARAAAGAALGDQEAATAGDPAAQQAAQAAAGGLDEAELQQQQEQHEQGDEGLLELAEVGQQQDLADQENGGVGATSLAAAGAGLQDTAAPAAAAEPAAGQANSAPLAASPGTAAAAAAAAPVGGGSPPASGPTAAPSLLSHPEAAATDESELEAAATAGGAVEQAGPAANTLQLQQQQPDAGPAAPLVAGLASGKQPGSQPQQGAVLEGTGENAVAQEVVGDSCGGPGLGGAAGSREGFGET